MAETLITLTILGVIAAITVPALVRRHMDSANKVKIKKAMAIYDTMMHNIVAENDIKSNVALENFLTADNCNNIANYLRFKERNNCTFETYDDVYWQFPTEYNNEGKVYAMVGFKESNVNTFDSVDAFKNYSIESGDPIFEFVSTYTADGFRVNDRVAFSNNSNMEHLYNYLNNKEQVSYTKDTTYTASTDNQTSGDTSGSGSGSNSGTNSGSNSGSSTSGGSSSGSGDSGNVTGGGGSGKIEKPTLSTNPTVNGR